MQDRCYSDGGVRVYVETSIVSYLTARPARQVIAVVHQQLTRDWWEKQRAVYELYTSDLVILEAGRGDATAARARLDALASLHIIWHRLHSRRQ